MTAPLDKQAAAVPAPLFFQVSVPKLVVMSVLTVGAYMPFVWAYLNWDIIRNRTKRSILPSLRAVGFFGIFLFPLLHQMRREAIANGSRGVPFPTLLAAATVLMALVGLLGGWFVLLSLLDVAPLALAQARVNELHAKLGLDPKVNSHFTVVNVVFAIMGGPVQLLRLWAYLHSVNG